MVPVLVNENTAGALVSSRPAFDSPSPTRICTYSEFGLEES
jgi:hypothetical protein